MSFLDNLYGRRKKLSDVLADEEYYGIRRIVEELYPDRAHFIYELLQNAEDTGATEVNFFLNDNALFFEHNGRSFDKEDVEGITNIGKGAKESQENKIGRFGVGFKAVFAYSETPRIWSPTFSFKIEQLVLPVEIPPSENLGNKTRFEFPFNNPQKSPEVAFAEIAAGLEELTEVTLLFLRNIEAISWKISGRISGEVLRIQHSDHHVEVLKQTGNKETSSSHFLLFATPIEIDGRPIPSVSIAYALEFLPKISDFTSQKKALSKQLKIVPANLGHVAVFFPAEKETSGLRFHLHAPFVPELSRASIKETSANDPLFNLLAELAASSLHDIRDLGLLTGEFLSVLPNPVDTLPKRYEPIRQSIIEAMNNEPLTPTHSKSHAPARHLLQAKASLKELLSEKDLEFLVEEDEPPKWAIGASQRNSNQDRFLAGLAIEKWDIEEFIDLLCDKVSKKRYPYGPYENFMAWLSANPPEWHQQMYSTLYKELNEDNDFYRLEYVRIVRLRDGSYSIGKSCYFPGNGVEHDETLPRVNSQTYLSGKKKTQQATARMFLEKIGVREVGETEEIEGILKSRYTYEANIPNKETYFKDLRRFIKLVEQNPTKAGKFEGFDIFKRADDMWSKPSQVYLDSPYLRTGLSVYYDELSDKDFPRKLSDFYRNKQITTEKLVTFAKTVGVKYTLPVTGTNCYENPQLDYLRSVPGERYTSPINRDYVIERLDELLESPSLELSNLVWKTMSFLDPRYLQAEYQKNWSNGARYADSQLVHVLKKKAWVPQKNGEFVRPCDAAREELPKGFPFDEGMEWIERVRFGENAKKRSEEYKRRNQRASELDVALEDIELLRRHPEEFEQWKATILAKKEKPTFPTRISTNPERRQERLAEQINEAPEKKYEQRNRSVRITKETIDEKQWLKEQYTNDAGQMICQICKEEMPFRKRDGEYYFEAVEVLPRDHFAKEHEAQFLALCPLCAAMYNEFVKHDEGAMESLKKDLMNSEDLEVPLKLGELGTSVRFVDIHFRDIKTIIEAQE